jgi:DNA-directed RNA polymerase specialized sigma54-like protein
MAKNKEPQQYDEDEAVRFIQSYLPQDLKGKFTDDEINYIIDIVYDYYDDKGLLNDDIDESAVVSLDEEEMIAFVLKAVRKDNINDFSSDEITFIVQGELAYCESIGIFE